MAETPADPEPRKVGPKDGGAGETPPSAAPTPPRPLRRSRSGRVLAGVCAGLGHHTDIDPIVYRVVFALLTVASGAGVLLYLLGWLIIPDEHAERSRAERILHRRITPRAVLVLFLVVLALWLAVSAMGEGLGVTTLVLLAVLLVILLVAHARGVDVVAAVRSVPAQVQRQPTDPTPPPPAGPPSPPSATGRPYPTTPYPTLHPTTPYPIPTQPPPTPTARRGRALLTPLTLAAATSVAGMLALLGSTGLVSVPVELILAAVLVTTGLGLVLGTWYGRGPLLVLTGLAVSAALVATTVDIDLGNPLRGGFGDVIWRPTSAREAAQPFRLGGGDATLDLTALPPRRSGYDVEARLSFGELRVRVPPEATVDVDAYVGVGAIDLPGAADKDGLPARSRRVIPPTADPTDGPTDDKAEDDLRINLTLRVSAGAVEVRRAPT